MARLPYVATEDIPAEYSDISARNINIYKALANNLKCAREFSKLGRYIRYDSTIDPRLREMVTLQVGYVADCAYEFYHHVKIGHQFGVSDEDIHAMIAETSGRTSQLDELTRSALRLARQLTLEGKVDDEVYAAVAEHLPNDQLLDLVVTVCHYNSATRFLKCFEVDLEDTYGPLVAQFPLRAAAQ
ncbi:MAG: carboxymuconolactone decarboxylase family protein [Rhizobiaceae bacterium]|nr:carboxymuconolactone decarboxylase family protein [Rhizobiaceae bacterium]